MPDAEKDPPACDCESMGGRFGSHRPECPWQIAFEAQVVAEKDALRSLIHETATLAINAVYGTDDKHAYMGLRIAQSVVDGSPLPWKWDLPSLLIEQAATSVTSPGRGDADD